MYLQVRNLTGQLTETSDEKCRIEERLSNLQRSLVEVEEDKRGLDSRFASAQTAMVMQEETIRRKHLTSMNFLQISLEIKSRCLCQNRHDLC